MTYREENMNLCEVQKGFSFKVKLDYNDEKGLANAFCDFRIEPVDPVCMIMVFKVADGKFM
ncbi:MAG: hypothetical protein K2L07_13205 [Lachnospiraceae bacterium]|nr:hypothetical protein [Lachnospiraceae bacterium]